MNTAGIHQGRRVDGPSADHARRVGAEVRRRFGTFVRECVDPGAEERDALGVGCPPEVIREAREVGLFTLALPKELGGGGADLYEWGLVLEQLGYLCDDASFPALLSARVWVTDTLFRAARPEHIERYVVPMARAERFGSFAYSDGADPFDFSSTLRRDGSDLVVNGEKTIVTGATSADIFVVFLNDEASGDLVVVLVERDDPGVRVESVASLGVRGLGLGALRMEDVRVPGDRLVVASDGLTFAQRMLNARRVLLVAGLVGAMQAVHERCIAHLSATFRYGMPLIEMQNVQAAVGRQYIAVEGSRAILHRALSRLAGHEGRIDPEFDPVISAAKHEITNRGIELAISSLRLLGGRGYLRGPAERFLRDTCSLLAAGGTQDVLEIDLGVRAATEFGVTP